MVRSLADRTFQLRSARAIQQADATTLEATGVLKGEGDAPMASHGLTVSVSRRLRPDLVTETHGETVTVSRRESPRLLSAPESPAEEILLDVRGNSFGRWQEKGAIVSRAVLMGGYVCIFAKPALGCIEVDL